MKTHYTVEDACCYILYLRYFSWHRSESSTVDKLLVYYYYYYFFNLN